MKYFLHRTKESVMKKDNIGKSKIFSSPLNTTLSFKTSHNIYNKVYKAQKETWCEQQLGKEEIQMFNQIMKMAQYY